MTMTFRFLIYLFCLLPFSVSGLGQEPVFPHRMPDKKPDFELSSAMQRMFRYPTPQVQDNELFSQFKYTRLQGLDYNGGDGTVSRRDPSRPVLVDGQYHIWYTKRRSFPSRTASPPWPSKMETNITRCSTPRTV